MLWSIRSQPSRSRENRHFNSSNFVLNTFFFAPISLSFFGFMYLFILETSLLTHDSYLLRTRLASYVTFFTESA